MNIRQEIMTKWIACVVIALVAMTTMSYSKEKSSAAETSLKFSSVTETTATCALSGSGEISVSIRLADKDAKAPESGEKSPAFRKSITVGSLDDGAELLFKAAAAKAPGFELEGLAPDTKYVLDVYSAAKPKKNEDGSKLLGSFHFTTLATEPTAQAGYIGFAEVTESSISMNFVRGNGKNRVVLVRKDKSPELPTDGKPLAASTKFGTDSARVGQETYCIYNGSGTGKQPTTVTDMESGKYFFEVLEYNGQGESANYLNKTSNSNPRAKRTALPAPKLADPQNLSSTGFEIAWSEIKGADTYFADLATDEKFSQLVDVYAGVDVGKITNFELSDLAPGKAYFFRVRAVAEDAKSAYSNVVKVVLK